MKVVFFNRKQRAMGNFSIESYFKQIRQNLPANIKAISMDMPFESNGLLSRLANAVYCMFNQGDVNHITGDIHYVGIFLSRKKTILTILDCLTLHRTTGIKHEILKWFWFTAPISYAKHITAISVATKNDILNFITCDPDKISVIYVSINDHFKACPKPFNSNKPRILHIGTAQNKNLERLIASLQNIACTLVIVGKISEHIRKQIEEFELDAQCIEIKLSDKEILEQYQRCDILSFVSTHEGFGMPIVEANSVGRVVISSNTSSMPEIAGNAAYLVDPFNTESIRDGFLTVISNTELRNSLITNGFNNYKRFQAKDQAQRYADIYMR